MKSDSITIGPGFDRYVRMSANSEFVGPAERMEAAENRLPDFPDDAFVAIEDIRRQGQAIFGKAFLDSLDAVIETHWGNRVLRQTRGQAIDQEETAEPDGPEVIEEPDNIVGMALHKMTPAQRKEAHTLRTAEAYELAEARRQHAEAAEMARKVLGGK